MLIKLFFSYIATCIFAVSAQDLGLKNLTFKIDADARLQIKNLIQEKYSNGEVQRFWKNFTERSVSLIKNPTELSGITTSQIFRTELVDLKYRINQDFYDLGGNLIVKKGTIIEPLKFTTLKNGLLFIDGRDQRQINYALEQIKFAPLKIILVAGSPYELRLKYRHTNWMGSSTVPFYFDQRKMIINQLSRLYHIEIKTVPVKLTQSGNSMLVSWGF